MDKTIELTPERIREVYNAASPYQVKDIMKNYIGQKICWDLIYATLNKNDREKLNVFLFSKGSYYNCVVMCNIKENDFPLIKILPPNSPLRLVGTIGEVNGSSINIENAHLQEIRDKEGQIYFPYGSREELLAFLKGKILGAKNIKIYDSYPSNDILILLESASVKAEIQLLGQNIDNIFSRKIKAFNIYFNKNMVAKKIDVAHARFYIIDGEVLHVDPSLKNSGGNKATMIHIIDKEAADAIKKDFDKWWENAVEV